VDRRHFGVLALSSVGTVLGGELIGVPGAGAVRSAEPAAANGPLVIGHRGASGYRPEHTLAAYRLAIQLGADVIEPDLVPTKDGVLIARHENNIAGTTDVADHPEYADRKTTKTIDGVATTGWFTEDFTLAEIKTLRAKERLPELRSSNTRYDGEFEIPTLREVFDLARKESRRLGRTIRVYPEAKHPTYFRSVGLALEPLLVATLKAVGWDRAGSPVFLQSFEPSSLQTLAAAVDLPVFLNIDASGKPYDFVVSGDPRTYADLAKPKGLRWIASWGDGVSLNKDVIIPRDSSGRLTSPTTVVADAHAEGLLAHSWTFRNENTFLPLDFRYGTDPAAWGDAAAEYQLFYAQGLDAVFSDFPDYAVAARDAADAAA
jgi:glycerophosphoryl diester phosphodiesterase